MGKILDEFMEKHELNDSMVLVMIADACIQIIDPEFVYNSDKNKFVPEAVKEEASRIIPEAVALSFMALIKEETGGIRE